MASEQAHLNALHNYKHIIGESTRPHDVHDISSMDSQSQADHLHGSHGVGRLELRKVHKQTEESPEVEDNFAKAASWPQDGNGFSNADTNGGDTVNWDGLIKPSGDSGMTDVEDQMPSKTSHRNHDAPGMHCSDCGGHLLEEGRCEDCDSTADFCDGCGKHLDPEEHDYGSCENCGQPVQKFAHNNDLETDDTDLETYEEQDPDAQDPYIGDLHRRNEDYNQGIGSGYYQASRRRFAADDEDHDEVLEESLPFERQQSDSWDPSFFDGDGSSDQESPGEKTSKRYASDWGTLDQENSVLQPGLSYQDKRTPINSSEEGYDYNPNYSTDPTRKDNMTQDLDQAEPHAFPSVPSLADYSRGLSSAASRRFADSFDGDTNSDTDDMNSDMHDETYKDGKFTTKPTTATVSPGYAIMEGKRVLADVSWFSGDQADLFDRMERLRELLDLSRQAMKFADNFRSREQLVNNQIQAKTQIEELQRTASFYTTPDEDDYLATIPGVTVAADYFNPTVFGTIDLGESSLDDSTSPLYYASKDIEDEFNGYDWKSFVTTGAKQFVEALHPQALDSEIAVREASVNYVHKKTLPILDIEQRAAIIDTFVSNSELTRRALNKRANILEKASQKNSDAFFSAAINDSQRLASGYSHIRNNLIEDFGDEYDPEQVTHLGAIDEFSEGERYASELKKRNWPSFLDHEASRFLDELDPGLYDYPNIVVDNAIEHIAARTASIAHNRREKIVKGFVDRVCEGLQGINSNQRFEKSSSRLDSLVEGSMSDRYLKDSFESQDIDEITWL